MKISFSHAESDERKFRYGFAADVCCPATSAGVPGLPPLAWAWPGPERRAGRPAL